MSAPQPEDLIVSDWPTRFEYDWTSNTGIARLRNILRPRLPYEPADFQVANTARLLNGEKVLCVSATGDGKSALFYMYSFARPDTMTVVVSPTNALETDMVNNLSKIGLRALAINSEALAAAALERPPRDLWKEARSGVYNIILLAPEALQTKTFFAFITCPDVRAWLALFCVDECHLVIEWGKDFRKAYGTIHRVIPWLVEWVAIVALTATLEPGNQVDAVARAIGFQRGAYHFEKRDCERHNVDIIIRTIQYTHTTFVYRDLDWLIPDTVTAATDMPKTLLYCESIELVWRIANYLQTLLPTPLQSQKDTLIRVMHSLCCPQCKSVERN